MEDKPLPGNVNRLGHVYTHEHNAFNCTPLAILNVNRASMVRFGFSPPTRVFEAAGAAACLITDAWEGVQCFLTPGTEVLVARDGAEVAAHVAALDHFRAQTIGEAARKQDVEIAWIHAADRSYSRRVELPFGVHTGGNHVDPAGSDPKNKDFVGGSFKSRK